MRKDITNNRQIEALIRDEGRAKQPSTKDNKTHEPLIETFDPRHGDENKCFGGDDASFSDAQLAINKNTPIILNQHSLITYNQRRIKVL